MVLTTERLTLREAEPEDLPGLLEVYLSNPGYLALTEGTTDGPGTYDLARLQRDWRVATITPGRVLLGIYLKDTGQPVGVADFLESNPNDGLPWLGLLMIHGAWQGQGLGREAFRALADHFAGLGWTSLRIGVLRSNEAVLPFWSRLGFRQVDTRVRRAPTGPQEVLVLQLELYG